MKTDSRQAVLRYYTAVDNGDIDGLLTLFASDAVYHRPGYEPLVGRADLEEFYLRQRVIDTGRHQVEFLLEDDSRVAVYGTFAGTLNDGTTVRIRFSDFFCLRDDGLFERRDTFFFLPAV